MASSTAGVLMISGSVLFFVGAGVAVPGVFTEPDRDEKLRMLTERGGRGASGSPSTPWGPWSPHWVSARSRSRTTPPPIIAAGVGFTHGDRCARLDVVAVPARAEPARVRARAAAGLALRRVRLAHPRRPAPARPGDLLGDWPAWLGWVVVGADAVFVIGYLRYGDIPPFVFYALLLVVGLAVL